SPDRDIHPRRQFGPCQQSIDLIGDSSQALTQRANIDIEDTADLVVVHFRGRFEAADTADHIKPRRALQSCSMKRDSPDVEHALNLLLGILHVEEVVVVVLWIDPDVRRHHLIRSERSNDVLYDFLLAQAKLA